MQILVIDAQGGGIGRTLVAQIKKALPEGEILAVGTNSAATAAMIKAGADRGATGENAVVVCSRSADIITGPVGIVIADAMMGEITPKMASAIASADATRILIPFNHCGSTIVGTKEKSIAELIAEAVEEVRASAAKG